MLGTGVPWYAAGNSIGIVNAETGESVELTKGKGSNWMPSWSPDGRYLAFYSDRGTSKRAELWLREISSGVERRLTDIEVGWKRIQWTPDSKQVLVLAYPENTHAYQL